jgi:NTE family protein
MKKWGLVLSGGIALGLANVGVLEVMEEEGMRPDCLAGSSMGAIIGALFACGYSAARIHEVVSDLTMTNVARWSARPLEGGLHGGLLQQEISRHLEPLLGDARIADCRIPFVCVAGKVEGKIPWQRILQPGFVKEMRSRLTLHVFGPSTRLLDAIMASSAIPVVFSPVKIGENTYVDVGNMGAIPVRELKKKCHPDIVVATNTTPSYALFKKIVPTNIRTFLEMEEKALSRSKNLADVIIQPHAAAPAFRFDKGEEFIVAGQAAARAALPKIRMLISSRMKKR